MICARRLIRVDGKVRSDINYPCGIMDVVSVDKSEERFRVLYDTKGRFNLTPITKDQAASKLCRVQKISKAKKASAGRIAGAVGQLGTVPYLVTHDGRTVRFPDPVIQPNDTVRIDLASNKILAHIKFEIGNLSMITKGANVGRIGVITALDKHPGSFDIVHLKDAKGQTFATRLRNVFVIGDATSKDVLVKLPKGNGIKYNIMQERDRKAKGIKD